jgi:transposase
MLSMQKKSGGCQELPDAAKGVVIAIDVAKGKMDFGAFRSGEQSKVYSVKQDRVGYGVFQSMLDELRDAGYQPWIAFEPTGPYSACLRRWLLDLGERVVQVNGYHVKRTKEVRDNSPLKSDCKDPRVIADLVWQGCYQQVSDPPEAYSELRCASAEWASLSKEKGRLRNEFQGLLEVWFPELRNIFKDTVCKSARALVRRYENVTEISSVRLKRLRCVLHKASIGRTVKRAEEIQRLAAESIASQEGPRARRRAMLAILTQLDLVESRQEDLRLEMMDILGDVPEADSMLSLHGVGIITVAGILGTCGPMNGYKTYAQLEKFIGLNIYEISSGKQKGQRHISKRGQSLARYLLCQVAIQQVRTNGLYKEYSDEMKKKGKKAGQIRVAVARKLLRILYAMGRDCESFDPLKFITGRRMEDGQLTHQGTLPKAA